MQTDLFKALSDPTRRAVFERLAAGKSNATQLRSGFDISQPAISQHLAVLRAAGLIEEQRDGRQVIYSVKPEGLEPLQDWLVRYGGFWPGRIERLSDLLKEMDQ